MLRPGIRDSVERENGVWRAGQLGEPSLHGFEQVENGARLGEVVDGLSADRLQKKLTPARPVAVARDGEEPIVVGHAVCFEVGAHVQCGSADVPDMGEKQRDQQPSDSAVAVGEGMHRLALRMKHGRLHEPV